MKHVKILLALLCVTSGIAFAQFQTWRSTNGHSFEGKLLDSANGQVRLQGKDGSIVSVPIAILDEASRAQIGPGSGSGVSAGMLTKATALYHAKDTSYEYFIGKAPDREYLQIRLMEGGKPIPHYGNVHVRFNLKKTIQEDDKHRQQALEMTDIVLEDEKTKSADFRILYENGAEILVETRSMSDGVGFIFTLEVIPEGEDLDMDVRADFPTLLEYDKTDKLYRGTLSAEGVPFEDLETLLAEYKATGLKKGETTTYGFHESPSNLKGEKITVESPARSDIVFGLEGQGAVATFFYGGKKIIEGFSVKFEHPKKEGAEMPEFYVEVK